MKRVLWIPIGVVLLLLVVFTTWKIRMHYCIEKKRVEIPEFSVPENALEEVSAKLDNRILDVQTLTDKLKNSRMLLVGETHLKYEEIAYFLSILDHLPDEQLVLNLELPPSIQNNIDAYMESGEEHYLDTLKATRGCLPFQEIIRWSFRNRERVERVIAMDETLAKMQFNRRYLCTDTRNETMKKALYRAYRDFPDAKIIAYGGQLHMLKSGRYKFDIKNRTPAGNRLINSDIPDEDIRIVMISGEDEFPLSHAWNGKIGAMEMRGEFARLPFTYFYTYPVYRASYGEELFDFYVNVGKTTQIEM
jgi:hypothetical protein